MVDFERLKKAIQRKGLSFSDIAKDLGVTRSCISHKMRGVIDFKVSQVYLLAEILGLSCEEAEEIFFMDEKTENQIDKYHLRKRGEGNDIRKII